LDGRGKKVLVGEDGGDEEPREEGDVGGEAAAEKVGDRGGEDVSEEDDVGAGVGAGDERREHPVVSFPRRSARSPCGCMMPHLSRSRIWACSSSAFSLSRDSTTSSLSGLHLLTLGGGRDAS
jgi:hypothetical protein